MVLHLVWIWDWDPRVVEDEYGDHRSSVKESIVLAFGEGGEERRDNILILLYVLAFFT